MEIIKFLVTNWDTIGLLVTNVIAYLAPSPKQKRKEGEYLV